MESKNYIMIGLSIALLVSLGFNTMPAPTHYCDSRELKAYCFDLSSTGKTCYTLPNFVGGKRCTEGWKEFIKEKQNTQLVTSSIYKQWKCNNDGCTPFS